LVMTLSSIIQRKNEVGIILLENYNYDYVAKVFWFNQQAAWGEAKDKLEVISEAR